MPKLPDGIWRRRLENEYLTISKNNKISNLKINSEKTEYHFSLSAKGYRKTGESVTLVTTHDVSFYLTREYPYAGGIEVIWDSPIFHPNIREIDGAVCIQLVNQWSEGQTLSNVVDALVQMLENPNPTSPLNKQAAEFFAKQIPQQKQRENKPRVIT